MSTLRGTGPLLRLMLRRDRGRLLAWTAGITLLVYVSAVSTKGIYPTQASLDTAAAVARDNPAALAFNGPDQALDTLGGQVAFQIGAFGLVMVGLMSLLLVGRATRGEEDSGRLELVRSMPVGRHAPLAAGLLVVAATLAAVGLLTTLSLLAVDLPVAGSVVLGASYLAMGLTFLGITAVAAQVSENPRVATGSAGGVLGIAFLVRAVGDIGGGGLSWASPIGWAQKARPFAGERWWTLALCALVGAGLLAVAVGLTDRRDFGAGLVAPRPGPAQAAPRLGSPVGLSVRLHRAAIAWWTLACLVLGATYGSLTEAIDEFVGDNQAMQDIVAAAGAASLTDSYLATSVLVIALLSAGPALQVLLRLRAEETEHRAEAVLSTSTSRIRWLGGNLAVALAGSGLALLGGGLGLGAAYAAVGGGASQVPRLMGASLVHLPAVWVLAGVALVLFAVAPRWSAGGWVVLTACLVIAMFGELLSLPAWVRDLSPFQHVPAMPAQPFTVAPVLLLAVLAAALVGAGLAGFRRRDLTAS